MEYKIGQVFEIDGIWYQFVGDNNKGCGNCVYYRGNSKCANPDEDVKCAKWIREDGRDGHFVRLSPIGDMYEQGGATWQQYKCIEKPNTEDKRVYIAYTDSEVGLIVSIRLTSSNDMENNEIFNQSMDDTKCSSFEEIGKNLKAFDLQAAKSGKPVCTRDGRKARIICFDQKDIAPIVGLVTGLDGKESIYAFYKDGRVSSQEERVDDLMMLPETKEGWVNVYTNRIGGPYTSREYAIRQRMGDCIDTVKIQWEE